MAPPVRRADVPSGDSNSLPARLRGLARLPLPLHRRRRAPAARSASPGSIRNVAGEFGWDQTLYAGSAAYYAAGRVRYPAELADAMAASLSLDGAGGLLDCACGPGSLTLLLAPPFSEAAGL